MGNEGEESTRPLSSVHESSVADGIRGLGNSWLGTGDKIKTVCKLVCK